MSQAPPPPPPPGASPPPPPQPGAAPFSIGNAIGYGWAAFWKNVGPMIVLTLVILVVHLVLSLIGQVTDSVVISIIFSIIGWLVGLLLALGLIRASLAVTRGERPEPSMLFQSEGFGPYVLASILFGLGTAIGLILCIIPGIIFAVAFWFYGYIISEEGDRVTATDALKRAADLSRGHRWELFGLGILLLLINIVGALLCGIGLLFTYGITALAVAYAYRSLNGQPVVQPT